MGDRKVTTIMGLLILAIVPFAVNDAFAVDYKKHVTAEDLGILQLAAHDLFNVFRCNTIDPTCAMEFENGKLDLSTLFVNTTNSNDPFDNDIIAIGGEARNRENIMLFTVASELGEKYVELVEDDGIAEDIAKNLVVTMYHGKLADTYQKTFGESLPSINFTSSTVEELHQQNLALRTIHDALPGKIKFDYKHVSIFDPSLKGEKLDKKELKQKSSKIDGKFDEEFREIKICFPPDDFPCIDVDLLEADRSFGVQFDTDESFDDFLEQLEDGLYDNGDSVLDHIRTLMAKGQNFPAY